MTFILTYHKESTDTKMFIKAFSNPKEKRKKQEEGGGEAENEAEGEGRRKI